MHRTSIISALALALVSRVAAQGIDHEDIGPNCVSVCTNIANAGDDCERQYDDDVNEDQQELECLCNTQNMDTLIPQCEACQRQYYGQDDDYRDIQTLLQRCGFSSLSMTMTSMASVPTSVYTTTWTSTETDDDDNDTDIDTDTETVTSYLWSEASATGGAGGAAGGATQTADDAASSATDAAGSAANGASDAVSSATDAAGSVAEQSGNFAPAITAGPVLAAAGAVAAAVFGL